VAKVVIGLSGGVDSSVAAHLLIEQGHEVIALFMRNWDDASVTLEAECPWVEDSTDALLVAEKLNIPFQVIDFSQLYKERIVDYMFSEYKKGRTPNPDVLCNREIKFDVFMDKALELGAEYVATGHYCRKQTIEVNDGIQHQLLTGVDKGKDQSYFLCQLNQKQLSRALFPIGELQKSEVRSIAKEQGFVTADKKDSQGLCFIGKVHLPDFLQQKLAAKKGQIIEISESSPKYIENPVAISEQVLPYSYLPGDGTLVGTHQGAHYFTIGQRKGIGVGGKILPLFVLATDVKENILYVGQGKDHPGLLRKGLFISLDEVHWLREDQKLAVGQKKEYMGRIRYRQPLCAVILFQMEDGLYLIFDQDQKSIAAGQFAAWYEGDELIGSGVINK
jgi:tRNA-uridine 2-sulfurtransferase